MTASNTRRPSVFPSMPSRPASRKAKLPPELERVRVPEKELSQAARLDWKKINDHRSAYLDRWNKEVLGKG